MQILRIFDNADDPDLLAENLHLKNAFELINVGCDLLIKSVPEKGSKSHDLYSENSNNILKSPFYKKLFAVYINLYIVLNHSKYDFILISGLGIVFSLKLAVFNKKIRNKIIFEFQDELFNEKSEYRLIRKFKSIKNYVLSKEVSDNLSNKLLKNNNQIIIEKGIPLDKFKYIRNKQLGLSIFLVCPDPITENSRHETFIESLKYLPSQFCIIFTGSVKSIQKYQKLSEFIKLYNLSYRTIFKQVSTYKENISLLESVSLGITFLYVNDYRPALILSTGTPVAYFKSNIKDTLPITGRFVLETGSHKNVAKEIKDILHRGKLDVDLNKVRKSYSWENKAKEYLRYMRSIKTL
jgi:hypothetical protein